MPDNPASATLAGYRAAIEAASPLPWEIHVTGPGTPYEMSDIWRGDAEEYVAQDCTPADGEFIVTARTAMPLLVAAVEAALKEHQPVNRGEGLEPICGTCHRGFWPCPTYEAIGRALAGGGGGEDGQRDT